MKQLKLLASSCTTIEFWLKRDSHTSQVPQFEVRNEQRCVFKVDNAAPVFHFYSYTHYADEALVISVSEDATLSLGYFYNKQDVYQIGINYIVDSHDELVIYNESNQRQWLSQDPFRPTIHFTPFMSWMNDPNGMCKIGDEYHIFYQFYPNGTEWGPMHWGHAVSKDLMKWRHLPVFNHPEQNLESLGATGGAFSGTAFKNAQGKIDFFYTERLPAYDLYKDYIEIQKKAQFDRSRTKAENVRVVVDSKPKEVGCDIRDPKVWFDEESGCYRMLLGSVHDGDPAVLLYVSSDSEQWQYDSVLYKADPKFALGNGRCVECPDFFPLGDKWVLIIGIVGYQQPETKRDNLLYAITGNFTNGKFIPDDKPMQVLDFATEYYALQTFYDGERQIGIAWLYNWAMKKPIKSVYNGEMSIPKVLSLNDAGDVTMRPIPEIEEYITSSESYLIQESKTIFLNDEPALRVRATFERNAPFIIKFLNEDKDFIQLSYDGNIARIEDTQPIEADYRAEVSNIDTVEILIDSGVFEVFINDGDICGTKRNYKISRYSSVVVDGATLIDAQITVDRMKSTWQQE